MFELAAEQAGMFFTWANLGYWGRAMITTLTMAALGCGFGFIFAFLLVYFRTWPLKAMIPFRIILTLYVEVFRRIPFLVLTFLVLFGTRGFGFEFS